jgi:anti-sigma B factor antagonist
MNMRSHISGTTAVLELSGRFDSYVAPRAAEWLEKITTGSPAHVVVNMSEVNFVDSTGLATLVQGLNRARKRNGELYLCGLQKQVYMIFELTRLDKAFHIFVDEDHALHAITATSGAS